MSATISKDWTVNGKTKLNDRIDVTDEVYVSNKKLKSIATSGEYGDLLNRPVASDINSTIQPPRTLTAAFEGGYEATHSSSTPNYGAHKAFGRSIVPLTEGTRWLSAANMYNVTTGAYTGTAMTATTTGNIAGEWVQLKLPALFKATAWTWQFQYVIGIMNFTLCGSTDGVTFRAISSPTYTSRNTQIVIGSPDDFLYYRVIVTANDKYTNTSLTYVTFTSTPPQLLSDWNATSGPALILNKPAIPAAQVNADWNATTGLARILNRPLIQSGNLSMQNGTSVTTITFPVPFQSTPNVTTGVVVNYKNSYIRSVILNTVSTTGFTFYVMYTTGTSNFQDGGPTTVYWIAHSSSG